MSPDHSKISGQPDHWYAQNSVLAEAISREGAQACADRTGRTQTIELWDEEHESWVIYAEIEPGPRHRAVRAE